jgi:hypothetical protein
MAGAGPTLEALERYAADISYECPLVTCRARRGEPCRDVPIGKVHDSRRIARLQREEWGPFRREAPRRFILEARRGTRHRRRRRWRSAALRRGSSR